MQEVALFLIIVILLDFVLAATRLFKVRTDLFFFLLIEFVHAVASKYK